jgi:hypothetical protein
MTQFIKAVASKVPVEKTKEDLRLLVKRYGARGFGVRENWQTRRLEVELLMPNRPGDSNDPEMEFVPLRIPVDVEAVETALLAQVGRRHDSSADKERARRATLHGQAERTAWRIVFDLVDAMLASVILGGRTVAEVFQGDVVVQNERGESIRFAELVASWNGQLPGGGRILLLNAGQA